VKNFGNSRNRDLVEAVYAGNSKFILAALRNGTKPNACYRGRPLLIWAIQEKRLNIVKALVRAGASVEKKDDLRFTPLGQAVGEGDVKIVRFLIKAGARVNQRSHSGTPLHTACAYRRFKIAKILLFHGANARALNNEGKMPADLTKARANTTDKKLQKMLKDYNAA
jgi:ankyrin repeat protein